MSRNLSTRKIEGLYQTIFDLSEGLSTGLQNMVPLAKKMHLLSSNAVSSAARAGSEGDAFRVLTQDIQLLGNDVTASIDDSQLLLSDLAILAAELIRVFSNYVTFSDLAVSDANSLPEAQSTTADEQGQQAIVQEIFDRNKELENKVELFTAILEPVNLLVKKGQYLVVFSSVEAANAGQHAERFEAVSSMLRTLVEQLGQYFSSQYSLLRDLSDAVEKLNHHGKRLNII